jgi:GTPase
MAASAANSVRRLACSHRAAGWRGLGTASPPKPPPPPPAAPPPDAASAHSIVYVAPDVQRGRLADGRLPPPPRAYKRGRPRFVDRVRLAVSAGHGGAGAATFTRGPNSDVAPPDGGSGGPGGSVWLLADDAVTGLNMWMRHAKAGAGGAGSGALRRGRAGEDCVVRVPPGTVATVVGEPGRDGMLLCDLNVHDAKALIARGGMGGRGNATYKSSTNRSPTFAQEGTPGAQLVVDLELKTIADVGLVGFPNAGKSTLLRAVSHAKPKVASYPFTTLRPHIGVVEERVLRPEQDPRRFTVADIPGLIAGAHANRGLGHEFLRHVERTSVLVYVLDMSVGGDVGRRELDVLMRELELYEPGLSKRPSCVAANKMDTGMVAVTALRSLVHDLGDALPVFPISALDNTGTGLLMQHLFDKVRPRPASAEELASPADERIHAAESGVPAG